MSPYIADSDRNRINPSLERLSASISVDPTKAAGEITYIISVLIARFFSHGKYWQRSIGHGILECAKMELYRRVDATKEADAILRHGDLEELKGYDV